MPAAMVITPIPPSALPGRTLGSATVTAAAKENSWASVRARAAKTALALVERPLHSRNLRVHQPGARLSR